MSPLHHQGNLSLKDQETEGDLYWRRCWKSGEGRKSPNTAPRHTSKFPQPTQNISASISGVWRHFWFPSSASSSTFQTGQGTTMMRTLYIITKCTAAMVLTQRLVNTRSLLGSTFLPLRISNSGKHKVSEKQQTIPTNGTHIPSSLTQTLERSCKYTHSIKRSSRCAARWRIKTPRFGKIQCTVWWVPWTGDPKTHRTCASCWAVQRSFCPVNKPLSTVSIR